MKMGLGRSLKPLAKGLVAAALAACAVQQPADAEDRFVDRLCNIFGRKHARPTYSEPYYPQYTPQPTSPQTPTSPQPSVTPQAPETPSAPPMATFGNEAGAAVVDVAGLNTPNVMGNFLGTGRTIQFSPGYTGGNGFMLDPVVTSVTNAKIADNNSPIPRDRFGYRYHFYANTNTITGYGTGPNDVAVDPFSFYVEAPNTKSYDTHLNGFEFEKTFLGGLASVDVRLPIVTTSSSTQHLVFGRATGNPGIIPTRYEVARTPLESTGRYGTEMGNMQVILKGVLWQNENALLSGGLGVVLPTGSDTDLTVESNFGGPAGGTARRTRLFHIENETWGLSPFLAGVYAPRGGRWFTQGFLEFETPLNTTGGNHTLIISDSNSAGSPNGVYSADFELREQMLMHVSWSTGFWLLQNPNAYWLRGVAPTLELHLTQSLTKGRSVTFPQDPFGSFFTNGLGGELEIPPPVIGRRGNVTFLDMTCGVTTLIGDRTTVATGFSVPLLSGSQHRTYDFEFQFQLNWFFGPGGFARGVPNF
jgi:hypothetical protein